MNDGVNKNLCRELYELSGWGEPPINYWGTSICGVAESPYYPNYSLGYLLRKLPDGDYEFIKDGSGYLILSIGHAARAATPEDAAANLCIELFKAGVLRKAAA
jgi:hypothetical protein